MPHHPSSILAYASPTAPATDGSRFQHLKTIFPFGGGLILGMVAAEAILEMAPDFVVALRWPIEIAGVVVSIALVTYALLVLWLIGCFARHVVKQTPRFCVAIGMAIPVLSVTLSLAVNAVCIVESPSSRVSDSLDFIVLGVCLLAGMSAPFLLVRWRQNAAAAELDQPLTRSALKKIALFVILFVLFLWAARWAVEMQYDRDCAHVAAWVKITYPKPGSHKQIPLPLSQQSLTFNHKVDAFVLADGTVVLALTTVSERGYWSGILYATTPIDPSETEELQHYNVKEKIDSRHFAVFNGGMDDDD